MRYVTSLSFKVETFDLYNLTHSRCDDDNKDNYEYFITHDSEEHRLCSEYEFLIFAQCIVGNLSRHRCRNKTF